MPPPAKRRRSLAYGALWALGIGSGAVAAGAFIGFLVNGPPQHGGTPRAAATEAATATSPAGAPAAVPEVEPKAPPAETHEAAAPTPAESPPANTGLPPLRPPMAATTIDGKAAQLAVAEVREVQGKLRAIGFDPGPVDGNAGPRTTNAAKQYQRARGLDETGTIDRDLLSRLRQENVPTPSPAPSTHRRVHPASTAAAPPRQRTQFLDDLDRLFRR